MLPECIDRVATDRTFFNQYIHVIPSGSRGAIEANMATKRLYDFMSALSIQNVHVKREYIVNEFIKF